MNEILTKGLTLVPKERLQNLLQQCAKYKDKGYSFVECGVAKGGCLATIKYAAGNDKIFGFDSFDGLPEKWRDGYEKGVFTTNGVLLGQGTSAFTTASSSTEGHLLTINASGVPTFSHLQGGTF